MASPSQFPILSVKKLQLCNIEDIFHLTRSRDVDWEQMQVPFEFTTDGHLDMLDRLLLDPGSHEFARRQVTVAFLLLSCDWQAGLPDLKLSTKCQFSFEPIKYKGSEYCLQGITSFSFWYRRSNILGVRTENNATVNFVAVETRYGQSSVGISQALAYMGMIHRQHRYEKKALHTIFGLSTDGEQFHFLQIDVDGKWSRKDMQRSDRPKIARTLRYIHLQACALARREERSSLSIEEDRDSTTLGNRVYGLASILRCLWQGWRKPEKRWPVLTANFDPPATEDSEDEN